MVARERERGLRREERCIYVGEAAEVIAQACVTENGLVLQEPTVPSHDLHRVDSESLIRVGSHDLPIGLLTLMREAHEQFVAHL